MTAVTCPIMRYHPAIIAQGAATLAVAERRTASSLRARLPASGLNEHVVGEGWPGIGERRERLAEAVRHHPRAARSGSLDELPRHVPHARRGPVCSTGPERARRRLAVAAGGPEAARLAGQATADGLITTVPQSDLIEAFRSAGGKGPRYAEVPMCYAASEDKAREIAHRYHRWSLAGGPVMPELPDTGTFAAASSHITPDHVAEEVSLGPSPEAHLEAIHEYIDAGFDHLIPDSDRTGAGSVLRVLRTRVAPCSCGVEPPRTRVAAVAELRSVILAGGGAIRTCRTRAYGGPA